jgi:hypothetical protein
MKIHQAILTSNGNDKDKSIVHVTIKELKEIEQLQNAGGFKRFSIDILKEYNERKLAKFFTLNREIAAAEVTHFLKRNLIIK